jgi:hypothetical protein
LGLIICIACQRQRIFDPLQRLNYYCSNCGAHHPQRIYRRKVWMDWTEKQGIIKTQAKSGIYASLRWIVAQKGYKPGWAAMKFKIIFGDWPPKEFEFIEPEVPTSILLWFIQRQNDIWKRQKRAEEKKTAADRVNLPPVEVASECQPYWMTDSDWDVKL